LFFENSIYLWRAQYLMAKKIQANSLKISEKQIEILARRLLPEIKKYFADEKNLRNGRVNGRAVKINNKNIKYEGG